MLSKNSIATKTAEILIDIEAVKFNIDEPFKLTSGKKSPVYCDCRKIISFTSINPSKEGGDYKSNKAPNMSNSLKNSTTTSSDNNSTSNAHSILDNSSQQQQHLTRATILALSLTPSLPTPPSE